MEQTLQEFLTAPFGVPETRSNEFEAKYKRLASAKKIHMEACTKVDEKHYLVHIKIGSESSSTSDYDVVVLFYTNDDKIAKDVLFTRYFVKFFSNSPSFIYQYATIYRQKGFLIDSLDNKLDVFYKNKMPETRNPGLKLSYDKSIYSACRFMLDHKVSAFTKIGTMARKKKTTESFFKDIRNFEDVKLNADLVKVGKKIEKTAAKDKDRSDVIGRRPQRGKVVKHAGKAPKSKRISAGKGLANSPGGGSAKRSKRITGK